MDNKKRLLVVDDEVHTTEMMKEALSRPEYEIKTTYNAESGLSLVNSSNFHLVITDIRLPRMDGIELLKRIKHNNPNIGVIVMTGYATVESAVNAMKIGAFDYVIKPFSVDDMCHTVSRYFEMSEIKNENKILKRQLEEKYGLENIIGKSKAMKGIYDLIRTVALSDSTVLIKGASGTGKELVARAIYAQSPRKNKVFITANCAAWPESLVESELFGHVKGAFTGATQDKKGIFEEADGGTILLDEISELNYSLQAKLLRVLQEREIIRVGSTERIPVDVRIIATTNRDLDTMIAERKFREDLFFRLNVVPITMPSLKEKKEDIFPLIDHFLVKFSEKNHKDVRTLANEVKELFLAYDWPGNVRELENLIERAIVTSDNCRELTLKNFKELVENMEKRSANSIIVVDESLLSLALVEKNHIEKVLQLCKGNKTRAAEVLGISVRTLRNKLNEYRRGKT
ncbi:MAG: sigma-54-dependent transcriptional regulator [Candidatus Zhuqueibacterota bacterium]